MPHAPGHEHGDHLLRLHVVGERDRRQVHVSARRMRSAASASWRRSAPAIPRPRRNAGCGATWRSCEDRHAGVQRKLQHTQFADFHGHGWVYRAVFKRDREGNLVDRRGNLIPHDDPEKFGKAVHLKDIHLEKGMQCVDCHFGQDNHGNGKLYGETRNAVEIDCVDCHGSVKQRATLLTSGPALHRRAARRSRRCGRPGASGASTGRTTAVSALDAGPERVSGRCARCSTRSRPGAAPTTSRRGSRRRSRRTARPGAHRPRPTSWRTPTRT